MPDIRRFVIVFINGDGEPIRIDTEPLFLSQKFPCPVDGFGFEIVAEAEVPEHLEEGVVISRPSDVVDITGSKALLTSCRLGEVEFDFAEKVVLELIHPGRSKQDRRIPSRDQDVAGLAMMTFGLVKTEVLFA